MNHGVKALSPKNIVEDADLQLMIAIIYKLMSEAWPAPPRSSSVAVPSKQLRRMPGLYSAAQKGRPRVWLKEHVWSSRTEINYN